MLTRRTVTASDVPTLRTPTEMKHQPFGDARHSTHPSPLGFDAGLIPRRRFFISECPFMSMAGSVLVGQHLRLRPPVREESRLVALRPRGPLLCAADVPVGT